jgi:hypothetical protein
MDRCATRDNQRVGTVGSLQSEFDLDLSSQCRVRAARFADSLAIFRMHGLQQATL